MNCAEIEKLGKNISLDGIKRCVCLLTEQATQIPIDSFAKTVESLTKAIAPPKAD